MSRREYMSERIVKEAYVELIKSNTKLSQTGSTLTNSKKTGLVGTHLNEAKNLRPLEERTILRRKEVS